MRQAVSLSALNAGQGFTIFLPAWICSGNNLGLINGNLDKFPVDFMFSLTRDEARSIAALRSQTVILKRGQHIKHVPYGFTERGAIMAATALNCPRAVQMSVFVVRAFIRMRAALADKRDLARKLAALEKAERKLLWT